MTELPKRLPASLQWTPACHGTPKRLLSRRAPNNGSSIIPRCSLTWRRGQHSRSIMDYLPHPSADHWRSACSCRYRRQRLGSACSRHRLRFGRTQPRHRYQHALQPGRRGLWHGDALANWKACVPHHSIIALLVEPSWPTVVVMTLASRRPLRAGKAATLPGRGHDQCRQKLCSRIRPPTRTSLPNTGCSRISAAAMVFMKKSSARNSPPLDRLDERHPR